MNLRPYQIECLQAIEKAKQEGKNRLLVSMPTGCHAKGQNVLLFNGSLKKVEDIEVKDCLMGPDSAPRYVYRVVRGRGTMFNVIPTKGSPFVVNEDHILSLAQTNIKSNPKFDCQRTGGKIVDVSVKEYLEWSKNKKHIFKLFRTGVSFHGYDDRLLIDPYFLGVLLGNGHLKTVIAVTDRSPEIVPVLEKEAAKWGMYLRPTPAGEATTYYFQKINGRSGRKGSDLHHALVKLGLRGTTSENKFVPFEYRTGSKYTRLAILAGLLDTDGHLEGCGFDFISKSETLSRDVAFLARSLGLAAYVKPSEKYCQTGGGGIYYRVSISGETSIVPCRVEKKKAGERRQVKDVLRTGFTIEAAGAGDYFGFSLTGDGRYLLEDFTVTHNCGKSACMAALPSFLGEKRKTIALANREELLGQNAATFQKLNPNAMVEIEQADQYASPMASIVIASVPSIGSTGSKRLSRFWAEQFGLMISDEAHFSAAPTWRNVYEYFGLPSRKDLLHVGFTATPRRGNGEGLGEIFEEIVYHKDIGEMIDEGWLAPIRGRRIQTKTDISRVRSKMGDFQDNELAEAVNNSDRNATAVKAYLEYGENKRCMVFAVDVAHTQSLNDAFLSQGIPAEAVTGTTPKEERRGAAARFRSGETKVLVNCAVYVYGYDEPAIEVIIMAKPSKSSLYFTQAIGRGLRPSPDTGKTHCLVIDLVDNSTRHSVMTIPSLFGLPSKLDLNGEDVRCAEKKVKAFIREHPTSKAAVDPESLTDLNQLEIQSQEIDFFTPPKISDEVLANSQLTWISRYGGWTMSAGKGREANIEKDILGQYTITLHDGGRLMVDQKNKSMGDAFKAADRYVLEFWPDSLALLRQNAGWKSAPATSAQLGVLRRMRVGFPSNITKGEASLLIGQKIASRG